MKKHSHFVSRKDMATLISSVQYFLKIATVLEGTHWLGRLFSLQVLGIIKVCRATLILQSNYMYGTFNLQGAGQCAYKFYIVN